jgi:hypothetical protein
MLIPGGRAAGASFTGEGCFPASAHAIRDSGVIVTDLKTLNFVYACDVMSSMRFVPVDGCGEAGAVALERYRRATTAGTLRARSAISAP